MGRQFLPRPGFPERIETVEDLEEFIAQKLDQLRIESPGEAQKLGFAILNHSRLAPSVLTYLRRKYLPSFSNLVWHDVRPYFINSLNTDVDDDHRSIPSYRLRRSRIPIGIFKELCAQLDVSRNTLGDRRELENEAAIQLYLHPIPTTILNLFRGRLVNQPGHLLKEQLAGTGRCEFTITFNGRSLLLFIELKQSLSVHTSQLSNIIAQVIAEADGADTFNHQNEFDGIPIHVILTDGVEYQFYRIDFSRWSIVRGVGSVEMGISWPSDYGICLPPSERSPDYLAQLKTVIEIVFDTFLQSYLIGLRTLGNCSIRRTRFQDSLIGSGYRRRISSNFSDTAHQKGQLALDTFREAHHQRVVDVKEAERLAETGVLLLQESVLSIPKPKLNWSLLENWETREAALLIV